jgi:hypoxanthine phosphoribosyltransferase
MIKILQKNLVKCLERVYNKIVTYFSKKGVVLMEDLKDVKVLISEEKIQQRLDELAKQIYNDYKGQEITFICILKGSIFFTVELAKKMPCDINFEFIRVSSYHGQNSTGVIEMKVDLQGDIKGKDVIIIEDIVDTGRTLSYLKEYLKSKEPKSIKICSMLDKKERRVCKLDADYVGFDIPDKFVVGYGLDVNEKYRNLPYIGYFENV